MDREALAWFERLGQQITEQGDQLRQQITEQGDQLREEMARNPLTVLPPSAGHAGPLEATGAELVGQYAIRITFSDGHDTGIYSWSYLRQIDPDRPAPEAGP